jgi:hypothetical protein
MMVTDTVRVNGGINLHLHFFYRGRPVVLIVITSILTLPSVTTCLQFTIKYITWATSCGFSKAIFQVLDKKNITIFLVLMD